MVLITIVTGVYTPTNITGGVGGAPPCTKVLAADLLHGSIEKKYIGHFLGEHFI